ncbi:hypothetical protein HDU86_006102 [Geranomyces michiganensis]|nr:hypothetical protein HDU86_006102 [Geranomyces michiganensis]
MTQHDTTTKADAPTYDYHGGSAPPKASVKVAEKPKEVTEVKDAVVHETIAAVEREEIQPVVERTREETEIKQVVQPVLDVQNEAPTVEKVNLEGETHKFREKAKAADVEKYEAQAAAFKDTVNEEVVHEKVYLEPIIHETVKKTVITEVQPVIERVVHQTHIVEETKRIDETFVKAPVVHDQEVAAPMSVEEFERLAGGSSSASGGSAQKVTPLRSPSKVSSTSTTSPTSPGPMTRLKRKKLSEAAEGPAALGSSSGIITSGNADDDGAVDVSHPAAAQAVDEPSKIRGTLTKLAGVVEGVVGELVGSDSMVADAEAKKAEASLELEAAAGAAKKRKVA